MGKEENYVKITEYDKQETWVYLRNYLYYQNNKYDSKFVGKWLLFTSFQYIDELWFKITKAFNEGKIWQAKCRTLFNKDNQNQFVICIYTKDYRDKEDVVSFLKLIQTNFLIDPNRKILYKTDEATRSNKYGKDSWTYCSDGFGVLKVNSSKPEQDKIIPISLEEIQMTIKSRISKYSPKDLFFVFGTIAHFLDKDDFESYKNNKKFRPNYFKNYCIKDISPNAKIFVIISGTNKKYIIFNISDYRGFNRNLNFKLRTKERKLLAKRAIIQDGHVIQLTYDIDDPELFFKFNNDMELLKEPLIQIFNASPKER